LLPVQVATSFIRFKVLLHEGQEDAVVQELRHMLDCQDFSADCLRVSAGLARALRLQLMPRLFIMTVWCQTRGRLMLSPPIPRLLRGVGPAQ
jgi:hypothetical protein